MSARKVLWGVLIESVRRAREEVISRVPSASIQNETELCLALVCAVLAEARNRGVDVLAVLGEAAKLMMKQGPRGGAPS